MSDQMRIIGGSYTTTASQIMADLPVYHGTLTFTKVLVSANSTGEHPCLFGFPEYPQVSGSTIAIQLETSNKNITQYTNFNITNYLLLYCTYSSSNYSTQEQLFYIAEIDNPMSIVQFDPNDESGTLFQLGVKLFLTLSSQYISNIRIVDIGAVSREEFNTLKNRVVTTYSEGFPSEGDLQHILGSKIFDTQFGVSSTSDSFSTRIDRVHGIDSHRLNIHNRNQNYVLSPQYYSLISDNSLQLNYVTTTSVDPVFDCDTSQFNLYTDLNTYHIHSTSVYLKSSNSSTNTDSYFYYSSETDNGIGTSTGIHPNRSEQYSIGTPTYQWSSVYSKSLGSEQYPVSSAYITSIVGSLSGNSTSSTRTLKIADSSTDYFYYDSGTLSLKQNVRIVPSQDSSLNLGASNVYYSNIFVNSLYTGYLKHRDGYSGSKNVARLESESLIPYTSTSSSNRLGLQSSPWHSIFGRNIYASDGSSAAYIYYSGNIDSLLGVSSGISPSSNNSYKLGTDSYRWSSVSSYKFSLPDGEITSDSSQTYCRIGLNTGIHPTVSGRDLGTSSKRWDVIYANIVNAKLPYTNSLTAPTINSIFLAYILVPVNSSSINVGGTIVPSSSLTSGYVMWVASFTVNGSTSVVTASYTSYNDNIREGTYRLLSSLPGSSSSPVFSLALVMRIS